MDVDDEPFVFRLLAYALVLRLDLRRDRADAVYFELLSERRLVRAWLDRQARASRPSDAPERARQGCGGGAPSDSTAAA